MCEASGVDVRGEALGLGTHLSQHIHICGWNTGVDKNEDHRAGVARCLWLGLGLPVAGVIG